MYLEFRAIDRSLENLHIDDLGIDVDEVVAINNIMELRCVVKESRRAFQSMPIKMTAKARKWLEENAGGVGHMVAKEKGWLVLGWKGKLVIIATGRTSRSSGWRMRWV